MLRKKSNVKLSSIFSINSFVLDLELELEQETTFLNNFCHGIKIFKNNNPLISMVFVNAIEYHFQIHIRNIFQTNIKYAPHVIIVVVCRVNIDFQMMLFFHL